jgi:hypothetical protein
LILEVPPKRIRVQDVNRAVAVHLVRDVEAVAGLRIARRRHSHGRGRYNLGRR